VLMFALVLAPKLTLAAPVVVVPLDDRPVSAQLPELLGAIAGVPVVEPPQALLGWYLEPGDPDRMIAWLNSRAPHAGAYVLSSDMLAYGGLVASRVPGVTYADAYFRLREIELLRVQHPHAWVSVFATIMRLAPTGVPALGNAAQFFAPYPLWTYLQEYANLHDPPLPSERARARRLRVLIGTPLLRAYLAARLRDYGVDHLLIHWVGRGVIDRLVIGQDDATSYGLNVPELDALERELEQERLGSRASIEPGADELAMSLVANAIARQARWIPRVAVRYSTPAGASYQDPLEFAPIGFTIDRLISLCGGVRDDTHPDIVLYVRVPDTGTELDAALRASMRATLRTHTPVALVDLSFEASYADQGSFAARLLRDGIASRLTAYASWNTDANSVGTALAESIAAGAGRRLGTYDALAHRTFTFMRFVDDDDFHVRVRPDLNRWLDARGVSDHTYLLPSIAAAAAARNRALLWNDAVGTLRELYPGDHIAAMRITLPWNRTFETKIEVRLAPNL
jgi:hypothetical protein